MEANLPLTAASQADFPWLSLIVLLPVVGALLMPLMPGGEKSTSKAPRNLALVLLSADFALMLVAFSRDFDNQISGLQLVERFSWIPFIGLEWSLGVDGLSAPLVVLSGLITLLSVAASWNIERKSRLYFGLLLVQASAQGLVFLSQDFLLFFLAWELELVPVYLLIAIWGGTNRQYAATKFILYTAGSSIFILLAALAMGFMGGGTPNFEYTVLAQKGFSTGFQLLCYAGLLIEIGRAHV